MNVPKLRFDGFSENWNNNKLGELFVLTSGTTPSRTNELFFKNGTNSWIKTLDLNNGVISNTQEKVTDLALEKTSLKLLPIGTVLIAMYGGFNQIGRTGLLSIRAGVNQALTALLPNENIAPFFLLSYLNYHVEDWKTVAASSRKDPNITKNEVANFIFIYPSFQEQTKIANFLTAVDDKISQLSEKCDLLTQYKKGVMQQIFSQELRFKSDTGSEFPEWESVLLSEVSTKKSSNIAANMINENKGHYKMYGAAGVLKEVDFYTQESPYVSIVKDGAGVGRLFLCESKSSVLGTMEILMAKNIIKIDFLFAVLSQINFDIYVSGSTIPHIYYKDYSKERIALPCLAEQAKIANFLSAIDAQINDAQAALGLTRAFKKGLLQQMFV